MIVKPKKKKKRASYTEEASPSSAGLLSADAKRYFDDWFGKILAYNQVCDDQIMGRIKVVAKEVEEGREKIKEEVKASVIAEFINLKCSIEYIRSSAFIFNIDPSADVVASVPPTTDLP